MSAASTVMEAEVVMAAELDRVICERLVLLADQLDILTRLVESRTLTRAECRQVELTVNTTANLVGGLA